MVVVPVFLNDICCSSEYMGISKDEGDVSLPLLAFRRDVVNAIFLKYSKEGRLSTSQVGIQNIPSDVFYDDKKHYQVQSEEKNKADVRCAKRTLDSAR